MNHDAQTTTTKGRQRIALSQSRDDGMLDGELERNSASSSDALQESISMKGIQTMSSIGECMHNLWLAGMDAPGIFQHGFECASEYRKEYAE